jgi:uncharacterized membrane protein
MTVVIFALIGGVVGGALLSALGGVVFGIIVGGLVGWVADLAGRVRMLERRLEARSPAAARTPAAASSQPAAESVRAPEPAPPPAGPVPEPAVLAAAVVPETAFASPRAAPAARPPRAAPRQPRGPSAIDTLVANVWRWFTTGNVPVKVGVVLSLFGVAFLVKEGIDRQWLVLPLEVRLVLVALFGIGLLALGWRLRTRQRTYALSIQGGGIGVLYLTIYASFGIYGLIPAALAFALLVGVTAAAGVLAVLQDARALAVLGTLGGFLAPVLASSDSGNHVALLGYYALLNVGVVGIAWFKAWRLLNVLGFLFTFGVGTLWGIDGYSPDKFATTEPFLILFTLMYLAIPVLFATRTRPELRGFVDGTLMFGTPIVAFALQSQLVDDAGLAVSAVALALLYVGMATFLYRSRREELRVLVEAQLALGVAFVTVAVPLALDARWTSAAWALQGAALVWLAFRQQRKLALVAGLALQGLSAAAYFEQAPSSSDWPIVNGAYLGALVIALAAFFSARLFDPVRSGRAQHHALADWAARALAISLFVWAGIWWFASGILEVDRHIAADPDLAGMLGFVAATAVLAIGLAARIDWPRLDWLGVMLWPFAAFFACVAFVEVAHPAEDFGWIAWPVVLGAMLWVLRAREQRFPGLRGPLHATAYWLAAGLVLWQVHWLVDRATDGIWPEAAVLALGAALVLATLRAAATLRWPLAANAPSYVQAGCGAVVAALTFATIGLNIERSGNAAPLPYLPLVNPLELASVLATFALLAWLAELARQNTQLAVLRRARPAVAAAAAWFLVTMTVARTVHHWAGVPYDFDSLASSTTLQSALSIVWGVAGLAAMLVGARTLQRNVWLVGAALMSVVVVKLFLVDLGSTGTLARVVSFLGVGVLLLVVGYFAPVPPRAEAEARAAS